MILLIFDFVMSILKTGTKEVDTVTELPDQKGDLCKVVQVLPRVLKFVQPIANVRLLLGDCIFFFLWLMLTYASLVGKVHKFISISAQHKLNLLLHL